jgi:hypothetical protein
MNVITWLSLGDVEDDQSAVQVMLSLSICGFSALCAEKPHTNEIKYRSAEGKNADCVT